MLRAKVNNIINNSSVDGPGNRIVVFFQGCNINCTYCHNPETIGRCIDCGRCVEVCPTGALEVVEDKVLYNKGKCCNCDRCIEVCKYSADPRVIEYTSGDLVKYIKRYKAFLRGVTFSGGECTLNSRFIIEVSKELKELGLDIYLDSNGKWNYDEVEDLISNIDKVMLDVKEVEGDKHIELTGYGNEEVLKNLDILIELDKLYEVRTVVVPGFLNNHKSVAYVAKKIKDKKIRYKLIKYRAHGVRDIGKYETPTDELMEELENLALEVGVEEVIVI